MPTRTLEIDLRQGTGAESEPMYGIVTVQRAKAKTTGGFEILPFETSLKLINGKATITEAETDGTGPFYDSVYLFRVQNGYCGHRYGFMAALPDGTTPITTGELPMVDPITGEGIYMDAQEWNDLYGDLPNRVSATENRLTLLDGQGQRGYVVKQDAGRTVSVWDYLNNREQMIYGDTGNRSLTEQIGSPWAWGGGGLFYLRRVGSQVSVIYSGLQFPNSSTLRETITVLPQGFRPMASIYETSYRGKNTSANHAGQVWIDAPGGSVDYASFSFATGDPWPTTLPGVAVGAIPA